MTVVAHPFKPSAGARPGPPAKGAGAATSAVVIALADEAATTALAARVAAVSRAGDAIALKGDLGTGKTAFARAFIRKLGHTHGIGDEDVPSPTFTLVQVYEYFPVRIWHFDLYRTRGPEDVLELGLEEALADGIVLIEWAEHALPLLPPGHFLVELGYGEGEGARWARLSGGDWLARLDLRPDDEAH